LAQTVTNPLDILESRNVCRCQPQRKDCPVCSIGYLCKFSSGEYTQTTAIGGHGDFSEKEMWINLPFVRGLNRDRQGDLIEIAGISTRMHKGNPVAMLDHGKHYHMPIGKCQDGASHYTVTMDPLNKVGIAKIYIWQGNEVAEQVFDGFVKGMFSAGSIQCKPLKVSLLPPDMHKGLPAGLHVLESELIEPTVTALPVNGEAVRDWLALDQSMGKSLNRWVRKSLEPYASPMTIWSTGMDKAMSAQAEEAPAPAKPVEEHAQTAIDAEREENEAKEPYGKQLLTAAIDDVASMHEHYTKLTKPCEHKEVRSYMDGTFLKSLQTMHGEMSAHHGKYYGSGSKLGEPAPEDKKDDEEEAKEKPDEDPKEEVAEESGKKEIPEEDGKEEVAEKEKKGKKPPFAKKSLAEDEIDPEVLKAFADEFTKTISELKADLLPLAETNKELASRF
jgi:hypothetical protein